jgi:CheY-like chemotaxis protein
MDCKILLVDDSTDLLGAYASVLNIRTSHTVRTAASGRIALEIIRTWRPDIVVTDVIMPDMNGLDLISSIRSLIPPPLPMIAVWSGFPEYEAEAIRRGAHVFQAKPLHPDNMVMFIESLLGEHEPPSYLRIDALARRRAASQLAQETMRKTLARRPYFQRTSELATRLVSRYFEDADVGLLVMDPDRMRVFCASGTAGAAARLERILDYAVHIVESGSTLILPNLGAMPSSASEIEVDANMFVAVPVRVEGIAIGALALADRQRDAFDAHDLAILEHLGSRYAAILADEPSLGYQEPGVLADQSWRYFLRHEIEHLDSDRCLVLMLAHVPASRHPLIPAVTPAELKSVERIVGHLVELLPPRTAMGRLDATTLALYALVEKSPAAEYALRQAAALFTDEPDDLCVSALCVTGLHPADGGAAVEEIAQWLLAEALKRGRQTALHARISPEMLVTRGEGAEHA